MSQLFSQKFKKARDLSPVGRALVQVQSLIDDQKSEMRSVGAFIGMESLNETQAQELTQVVENWSQSFERIAQDLGFESFQASQSEAASAIMAGISDIGSFLRAPVVTTGHGDSDSTFVGMEGLSDGMDKRVPAFEAYDERDNRNAVAYSVAYNMVAGRQNAFGEAFFPTATVTNDNVGVEVTIRLIQVYNDFTRDKAGSLAAYQKKNIVKAMIDNTILKNELTRIFPIRSVSAPDTTATFYGSYNWTEDADGISYTTGVVKFGARYDLLGLSQNTALIANGLMDTTDSIDPAVELVSLFIEVDDGSGNTGPGTDGKRVFELKVEGLAGANFVYSPQDLHRIVRLNFSTNNVVLRGDRTTAVKPLDNGAVADDLADFNGKDSLIYFKAGVYGEINLEQGDTYVQSLELKVDRMYERAANVTDPYTVVNSGDAAYDAFNAAVLVGYKLKAYRTNLNRRQRGQLLDVTYYRQIWAVPLRSPISVPRPVNSDAATDNSDLAALVSATFVRTSNEAVRTLTQTADMLKNYVQTSITRPQSEYNLAPSLFGVARFLIDPTYIEETVDVATVLNSVSSARKAADVQGVLVNVIRAVAARLYRDSGFQAVVDTQAAGVAGNPTVIVGTDPMTARYLMIDGEGRMAGPEFDYVVVTSPDTDIENQLFIALGYPNMNSGQLNPLHFGNMLWSPELVLTLPISRGGQISKELTVQPRFRHIVNVPVLGKVNVQNLPEAAYERTLYVTSP